MEGPFQFLKLNFSMNILAKNYILLATEFRLEGKASPQSKFLKKYNSVAHLDLTEEDCFFFF